MEWEQVLGELIEFVKSAAPQLWEIYRRQVFVGVAQCVLACILLIIAIVVLFRIGSSAMKRYREAEEEKRRNRYASTSSDDIGAIFAWVTAGVLVALLLVLFNSIIGRAINPDYYVIQMLLGTIGAR